MRVLALFLLFFSCALIGTAQRSIVPLHELSTLQHQSFALKKNESRIVATYPIIAHFDVSDSLADADSESWKRKEQEKWVWKKLRNEHLFQIRAKNFTLNGNAAFNLEGAYQQDAQGRRFYTNTRGYHFSGGLGKRIFFQTSFFETQSIFPVYMDSVVSKRGFDNSTDPERGSVPGFGHWKPFNTSTSFDYDYQRSTGTFGVMLNDHSFLQFGQDNQFVGHGYRSLLLSDGSSPYTFLKAHLQFWDGRITYSTTYALLQSLERVSEQQGNRERMFQRSGGRFTYLDFQPYRWLGLGLFEGSTWSWERNGEPESMQFYSPLFTINDESKFLHVTGFNAFVSPISFAMFYGQWAFSPRASSGASYQLGVKILEPITNLFVTSEINHVSAGFYEIDGAVGPQGSAFPFQSEEAFDYYQNKDLMLGHPMGVGVNEFISRLRYSWRDLFIHLNYHFGNQFTRDTQIRTFSFLQAEMGYTINPRSNAQIVFGNIIRSEHSQMAQLSDTYSYFAFRTQLFNRYLDF